MEMVAKDEEDCSASESGGESTEEDVIHQEYEPLEESIYGWAVSMLVRDVVWLSEGTHLRNERMARILNSIMLIVMTIALQVFLLFSVSRLLCAPQVVKIRETYGHYEHIMYPNHTKLSVNGYPRGIPGFRVDENFKLMSNETAKTVCDIPLSHPFYLASILFIWTLTCQVELRAIFETGVRLLWATPIVKSHDEVLVPGEGEHEVQVDGLTFMMKAVIGVFVVLPRVVTLLILLYLGCRWLTATLGLGDLLLNGLALEFMVMIKELLYNVCVSHRNRVHTQRLLIRPFRKLNKATCCTFFDSQLWGILSAMWVIGYMYKFQQVLPEYRWDVRSLCKEYLPSGILF